MSDTIEKIRAELFRLKARPEDVGHLDGITVGDRGNANAMLSGSPRRVVDFHWFESAAKIHERLVGLPDGAGPEAIRSEFDGPPRDRRSG
jgi:hypothetical protein